MLLAAVTRQVVELPRIVIFAGRDQFVVAHPQGAITFVIEEDALASNAPILGEGRHEAATGQRGAPEGIFGLTPASSSSVGTKSIS